MSTETEEAQIESYDYFPSTIYSMYAPNFLDVCKEVYKEYLIPDELDEIYPVRMSGNLIHDERMAEFNTYINQTAWNVLNSQGYKMSELSTFVTFVWAQEHHKHSSMEQHIHGEGVQLVGFYFLETSEKCSRPMFHDPRPGKVILNLAEADINILTPASVMFNYEPIPGTLIITNAWLPHSFSRHASDEPATFIHFSISVGVINQYSGDSDVEII